MTTTLAAKINAAVASVTEEQIDRCSRIYDLNGATVTVFYMVQSESDPTVEYKTTHDDKGFHCTCPAGQEGFAHCHKTGVCKHVIWAVAAAKQYRALEVKAVETVFKHEVPAIVENAETVKAEKHERAALKRYGSKAYESNTFSLMR